MTPLEVSIMIHYYTTPCDFRDGDFSAPAVSEFMDRLCKEGLLTWLSKEKQEYGAFAIINKGKFYVDYLCNIPLPVEAFEIPPPI